MINEKLIVPTRRLGRLPTRSDTRALLFNRFAMPTVPLPPRTNFWPKRTAFVARTYGNTQYGDCTIAKQAIAMTRLERLEVRRTAQIDDDAVIRVYTDLSNRLYGGGDNGAYETDALNNWRRSDLTFRDTKKRPLTIDAFTRLNPFDHEEIKRAIYTAAGHGIAICINLPSAFSSINPPADWDIPEGTQPVGQWLPGSWGGHSMWARDYDEIGLWLVHTWGIPDQRLTWRAAAIYLDEAHLVIDSLDTWRRQAMSEREGLQIDFAALKSAVNEVSSQKIK